MLFAIGGSVGGGSTSVLHRVPIGPFPIGTRVRRLLLHLESLSASNTLVRSVWTAGLFGVSSQAEAVDLSAISASRGLFRVHSDDAAGMVTDVYGSQFVPIINGMNEFPLDIVIGEQGIFGFMMWLHCYLGEVAAQGLYSISFDLELPRGSNLKTLGRPPAPVGRDEPT